MRGKQWSTAGDPCDWCADLEGQIFSEGEGAGTIGVGEEFFAEGYVHTVDAGTRTYDYEPIMSPPLHPLCRCTLTEILF